MIQDKIYSKLRRNHCRSVLLDKVVLESSNDPSTYIEDLMLHALVGVGLTLEQAEEAVEEYYNPTRSEYDHTKLGIFAITSNPEIPYS